MCTDATIMEIMKSFNMTVQNLFIHKLFNF